ncbi:MAG: ATP-binding domain-containing protein [Acidobacteria bacterium]|nr:ATP-binding domain-containing protein [Acidobacteriota bacterium]
MQFEEDFQGACRIDLNTTYRSTKNILEAANALIQPNKARIAREIDTTQDRGQPVQLLLTPTPATEAKYAAETARARIDTDGGSVAVLYRTNAQSRAMEAAFKDEKLPYKIVGGESFYESKEVLDSLSCISVTLDPHADDEATKRFVTMVPGERISKTAIRQIDHGGRRGDSFYDKLKVAAEDGTLSARDARIAMKRISTIETLQAAADDPPAQIIQKGLAGTGYKSALEQSDDKRRLDKLDNIEELVADAQQFALDQRSQATDAEPYNDQIAHGFVRQCEEIRAAAHEQEQNGQCVTLSTLHAAKGLEFDTVVFAGFDSERMPHRRSIAETDNPEGAVEEERRLAYVGMTRARTELHLTVPLTIGHGNRQRRVARSEFINDIPDQLIEQRLPNKPHPRPSAAADTERGHEREPAQEYAAASR